MYKLFLGKTMTEWKKLNYIPKNIYLKEKKIKILSVPFPSCAYVVNIRLNPKGQNASHENLFPFDLDFLNIILDIFGATDTENITDIVRISL